MEGGYRTIESRWKASVQTGPFQSSARRGSPREFAGEPGQPLGSPARTTWRSLCEELWEPPGRGLFPIRRSDQLSARLAKRGLGVRREVARRCRIQIENISSGSSTQPATE